MIQIVNSPTYKRTYVEPSGGEHTFDYNVVGALSLVSYTFKSLQASLKSIAPQDQWALLTLRTNINDYLSQVAALTGRNPQVFLEDTVEGLYDYTGAYEVGEIQEDADGNTQIVLRAVGNDSPTYFASKEFPDDHSSQLVYKYRTRMTYEVYDVSMINGVAKNVLLTTRRQQLSASGYNSFNISELAKGYVSTTGSIALKVVVTAVDHFGNVETVTTDPCILVYARMPEINYGLYTLFNPETGGDMLPTTGHKLLYNSNQVYPFYLNFITNSLLATLEIVVQLRVTLYKKDALIDTQFINVPTVVGLNTVDVSQYPTLARSIRERKPTTIQVEIQYHSNLLGEFSNQFSEEFWITTQTDAKYSAPYTITCEEYTLDDRRDFFFSYQNGIGGLSTYLCTEFTRSTESEIVALRNASTIRNSVARATESVTLSFKYADLKGLDFLLGYRIDRLLKYDGIYESQNIQRIGEDGSRLLWIIKASPYDLPNSTLYKDISFTVYRPIGMTLENGALY